MEITKVIDGDTVPTYPRTYGILAGWGDDDGRWSIDLTTREGYFRFESSNPGQRFSSHESTRDIGWRLRYSNPAPRNRDP